MFDPLTRPPARLNPGPRSIIRGLGLVSIVTLTGCFGPRNFENENDQLRAERQAQQQLIAKLQETLERRTNQLALLKQQADGTRPMSGVDGPSLAGLEFGRYSTAVDTNDDGVDDLIRLYVQPVDAKGRVILVAGRASLQAALVNPGKPPRIIAEKTYSPEEFDEAYRSTFLGRHYTLELPLPDDAPEGVTDMTVKLAFTNAATGAELSEQQAVRVERASLNKPSKR